MEIGWKLAAVPLLIAVNAFFVAAEYAVVAIRGVQIEAMRRRGKARPAAAMTRLKSDPASAIAAIQVCITMTNLLLGWLGEPAMSFLLLSLFGRLLELLPPAVLAGVSIALSFILVTLLTVVFSELLPKALTLKYVENVAVLTASPVLRVLQIVRPLVALMNGMANLVSRPLGLGSVQQMEKDWHTAEEIRMIAMESAEHGALTSRERSLILNSLALGRRTARQIMVPRIRVVHLDIIKSMQENRAIITDHLHSRYPLCRENMDHVIGVISAKEFFEAYTADGDVSVLQLIARPAVYAPDTMPLDKLLVLFDDRRTQMVFLVDEHGGVEGIVTLQDVVDELVGPPAQITKSLDAQGDRRPEHFIVAGDTPLHELALRMGREQWAQDEPVVTVGGLVSARSGTIATEGTEVEVEGVTLRVLAADTRAVRRVLVMPHSPSP